MTGKPMPEGSGMETLSVCCVLIGRILSVAPGPEGLA